MYYQGTATQLTQVSIRALHKLPTKKTFTFNCGVGPYAILFQTTQHNTNIKLKTTKDSR